jgi:cyclopropane fatty-acyl-phospholipid synthase-like methyltransferase
MKNLTYNHIARDYHQKRAKPWRDFEDYFNRLKNTGYAFKGLILDLGCGNGRHFELLSNSFNKIIGIDNSIELLKLSMDNDNILRHLIDIILADMNFLPIRPKMIHHIFAIATLHHIESKDLRKRFIFDSCVILKTNGSLVFTV